MKNPFKKNNPTPEPVVDADTPMPPESGAFNPLQMRETVFKTLAGRVGPQMTAILREDFDRHIAEDPVNGAEAAYTCLCGKLIETIDRFNDLLNGKMPTGLLGGLDAPPPYGDGSDGPVNPFTTFRKDG